MIPTQLQALLLVLLLTRKETIHIVHRVLIPKQPPTLRPLPRIPPPNIAVRATIGRLALPAQPAVRELDIIVLMLARDDERVRQFAVEGVAAAVADAGADGVRGRGVADVGAAAVFEVDDGEEVAAVGFAVLRFGEVEGALACGVGGGRGGCAGGRWGGGGAAWRGGRCG